MTSERLYVWAWLPGASTPIVCGVVEEQRGHHRFNYGRSYLENPDAIPLYGIPLMQGAAPLPNGLTLHVTLRDALPDAWGQHVILQRLTGRSGTSGDPAELSMMTYMRESSSDRFGALDFQESPTVYVDRSDSANLADLDEATEHLQRGDPLPRALEAAFAHGTSIGGARPKATLTEGNLHWIAKFSSTTDRRPAMRHEALALFLARRMGIDTVDFKLTEATDIVDQCVSAVEDNWASALEHARLTASQAGALRNIILNTGIHDHPNVPRNG
ncbi:HipA domain-containing protein [Arachnia propionica]|uniref:HipA domain-containing protein n=1 Tax=Arachnia propionica TaxID=1750 RepID=UPI000F6C1C0E|nr:HipA domain-containing protein [Arachnia propionica]VEJ60043.1 Uncharacterized protein related to capsule biosynthesis enzymes [Arachnia propionica]